MYFSSWCTADVYTMTVCSRDERSDCSVYFPLFLIVIGSEQIHSPPFFGLVLYSLLGKMPSYLRLVSKLTNSRDFYFLGLKYNPLTEMMTKKHSFSWLKKVQHLKIYMYVFFFFFFTSNNYFTLKLSKIQLFG